MADKEGKFEVLMEKLELVDAKLEEILRVIVEIE